MRSIYFLKITFFSFVLLFCIECSNPIEHSKIEMNSLYYLYMNEHIAFVNSTIEFMQYENSSDFWLNGFVIDGNKIDNAIEKLKYLVKEINGIDCNYYEFNDVQFKLVDAATNLHNSMVELQENPLRDFAYELINAYALIEGKKHEMPQKLLTPFNELRELIRQHYFVKIPASMFQLELASIGNEEITLDQFKEIRRNTLQLFRDSINAGFPNIKNELKKVFTDNLIESFSNQFPVNDSYEVYKKQLGFSGMLLQFMSATNENYCNFSNMLEGDCNWGYIYITDEGKAIYDYHCMGVDSIRYFIGEIDSENNTLKCKFSKKYSFKNSDGDIFSEDSEDASASEKVDPNSGVLSDIKEFDIDLLNCDCAQYPFIIKEKNEKDNGNDSIQTYVIKHASLQEQLDFVQHIKTIKTISDKIID